MYMYITSGTYDFVKKIKERYPEEEMILLQNPEKTEIWHESRKKRSVFASPRRYEILDSKGKFPEVGFASCHFIPVKDESRPIFEYEYGHLADCFLQENGVVAVRILRPIKNDTYLIILGWKDEELYSLWEFSPLYNELKHPSIQGNIFSGSAYVTTYYISDEEIDFEADDEVEEETDEELNKNEKNYECENH